MAFQPVLDTISLTCRFLINHVTPAQFTVFCRDQGTAWDGAHMAAKADAVADAIVADYLPALSQDHDFVGVTARDLEVQFGRVVENPVAATPGELASPMVPGVVAPICTFHNEVGAPRQGRIKLMPPAENQIAGDVLNGGAIAALQAAMEALHTAVDEGVGETHVILSRFSGTELVDLPNGERRKRPIAREVVSVGTVESVEVGALIGTQRSRRIA